jgi:hypothetical protein
MFVLKKCGQQEKKKPIAAVQTDAKKMWEKNILKICGKKTFFLIKKANSGGSNRR